MSRRLVSERSMHGRHEGCSIADMSLLYVGLQSSKNIWTYVTVSWLTPLMRLGYKRPLQVEDLYRLPPDNSAEHLSKTLDPFWNDLAEYKKGKRAEPPNLTRLIIRKFFWTWFLSFTCQLLAMTCEVVSPLIIKEIILYTSPDGTPGRDSLTISNGLALAFCVLFTQSFISIFGRTAEQICRTVMLSVRTICIDAVYNKSLRLSGEAATEFTSGNIMSLINVDAESISLAVFLLNMTLAAPVQVIIEIGLLITVLGAVPVLAALGVMLVLFIAQVPVMKTAKNSTREGLKVGDARMAAIREAIYGIKIIKVRALEKDVAEKIKGLREKQTQQWKRGYGAWTAMITLGQLTPVLMPIAAFAVYTQVHGDLPAAVAFPALLYMTSLIGPMFDLPQGLSTLISALVSWKRIKTMLMADETQPVQISPAREGVENAVVIQGATFKWEEVRDESPAKGKKAKKSASKEALNEKKKGKNADELIVKTGDSAHTLVDGTTGEEKKEIEPLFKDLNLAFERGKLTAVVGAVGAGKSSLLSAIIGEMTKLQGEVTITGRVCLCTQEAFIQSGTIKENILFQSPFDKERLQRALRVCSLESDLNQFSAGWDTEIGEKGVNLSGGQKARVALARAVYNDDEIYLLDDPISALDAHVGAEVFKNCVHDALAGKTRILVTHHLHHLQDVDKIVVLQNGVVAEQGTFSDLLARGGVFTDMMKSYKLDNEEEKKQHEEAKAKEHVDDEVEKKKDGDGGLIIAEDRVQGAVKWSTYLAYMRGAGGIPYAVGLLGSYAIVQAVQQVSAYWLAWWTRGDYGLSQREYLIGYSMLAFGQVVAIAAATAAVLIGNYFISRSIHARAFEHLIRAPMGYFDTQPVGRLLNRFSKDVEAVDQRLWGNIFGTCVAVFNILGSIILLAIVSPYMLLGFLPFGLTFFYVLRFYRASFRELKRLDSVIRSPLYAQLSETLTGIPTIRAYKAESRFVDRQRRLLDASNSPYYLMYTASVWIGIRLEIFTGLLVFMLALLAVNHVISAAAAGLAFNYAVPLTLFLNMLLRAFAFLESNMNSVERLEEYANDTPEEARALLPTDPAAGTWPTRGAIEITNLEVRYPSVPDKPVIRNLTLSISPGEKIGIVGRTGSGKSTLLTALFRIVEPTQGSITIDGTDIATLGLETLRSRLSIIPQEPIMFSGTLRSNLDLRDEFTDAQIWAVLERINLNTFVASLPLKLDSPVADKGENLSVGQRQLLCLGRVILNRPNILVMDEATASVDAQADALIQTSIRTHFAATTVLSIAHRLNTIADFDKVLVLDAGVLVEFDAPHVLLSREGSLFGKLADATGPANARLLRDVARRRAEGDGDGGDVVESVEDI
ncbi:P-loop containing nucleoside triphosphate hydrolase protein [Fimicolochytrium jonesii]|uniref:P-loop containing nucleoside triphosphate hydrolase protein n=1 Tax=Fimicolochytrium jonesii TaxID=1396493 RepID=UPI0022FDCB27|nr:P-loop containing nucleoside triphosphate hydrolase protein [Fimicolochytrium jonesii]KAI8820425.1 P-loop containing nucleoside triphosphate hydrolase protein [Fimicolochytrium jonesii]